MHLVRRKTNDKKATQSPRKELITIEASYRISLPLSSLCPFFVCHSWGIFIPSDDRWFKLFSVSLPIFTSIIICYSLHFCHVFTTYSLNIWSSCTLSSWESPVQICFFIRSLPKMMNFRSKHARKVQPKNKHF